MKYTNVRGKVFEIPDEYITEAMKNGKARMEAVQAWLNENGESTCYEEPDEPTKPIAAKSTKKRERKPNEEKRTLVAALEKCVCSLEGAEKVEIVKPEREVSFWLGNNNYSVVLTLHRNK